MKIGHRLPYLHFFDSNSVITDPNSLANQAGGQNFQKIGAFIYK